MRIFAGRVRSFQGLIGIVVSRFNREITVALEQGALRKLTEVGVPTEQICLVRVPGAIEIPLAARTLLEAGCEAVIALGAVIRGETSHYDYVCQSVERGCAHLALEFGRPVSFGVLTTENEEQARARTIGGHGNKGAEAAEVALEMLDLIYQIESAKPNNKEFE